MDAFFDQDIKEFQSHIARWVDERLVPQAEALDTGAASPEPLFRELGGLGYLGLMYPERYGGSSVERPYLHYTVLCEELARGSMGFAAIVGMHGSAATHPVYAWGSEALKDRYLVPALRGDMVAAFAITEPNAGSDAASIRTRAVKVDGGYRIDGTKVFISNGTKANFVTVAATSDPATGVKGLGLYLVDAATPGFSVARRLDKFTTHCSDTAELVFDGVFVPDECRLGAEAGGFLNAYKMLTIDRIFTAALAIGTGRAAYNAALQYSKERVQFGQPIGKFQAVQFKLVDMLATLEQARLYTYSAAKLADEDRPITVEAALSKIIAADGCNEICQKALNIFGGYGLMNEYPVQRYLRDSYFPMIGGGTSDIMRLLIARQLGT